MRASDALTRVYAHLDWAPNNTPESASRALQALGAALVSTATNLSSVFRKTVSFRVDPDIDGTDEAAWLDCEDAWVLQAQNVVASMGLTYDPNELRSWDARVIYLRVNGDTQWQVRRLRSVTVGGNGKARFALDSPWPNSTDTDIEWQICTAEYPFPADCSSILSVHVLADGDSRAQRAGIVYGPPEAGDFPLPPSDGGTWAEAVTLYVGTAPARSLPAPRSPPTQTYNAAGTPNFSVSGEATGAWRFVYTLAWGHWQNHTKQPSTGSMVAPDDAMLEPLYESEPSKLPATYVTMPSSGTGTIELTLPNVQRWLGFTGATRGGRTGLYFRIYGRCERSDDELDRPSSDTFYFLDEVPVATTSWTFDGTQLLDQERPAPQGSKRKCLWVHPRPTDDSTSVTLEYHYIPRRPTDPSDELEVAPGAAEDAVILRAAVLLCPQSLGARRAQLIEEYNDALSRARSEHGSTRPRLLYRRYAGS